MMMTMTRGPPPATTVMVDPGAGGTVPSNQQFSLTFDQGVTAATVNGTAAYRSWPQLDSISRPVGRFRNSEC